MFSTIHRFTPPTCTLEIKGKRSPLSRWQNQDLLHKIQFQLSFDDPRLPSDRQVMVTGDRQQLEQLKNAVDNYLQNNLNATFNNHSNSNQDSNHNLYLRSTGIVSQELFIGSLNCDREIDKINLSTTQLFDLVTALETYQTKIAALPELNQRRDKSLAFIWGSVAAGLICTVGITTILLRNSSVQNIADSSQPESSTPIPQLDLVVPPETPARDKKTPKPQPNKSLSSTKRLPPPPAVDTPKPKPDIPDPADYPLSKVARESGLNRHTKTTQDGQTESVIAIPPDVAQPQESPENNSQITPPEQELDLADNSINYKEEKIIQAPVAKPTQVQQIQGYFNKKWQPPADLKQSLEYRLYLNVDGSIKKVVPIGKASKLYLSQTNIPVQGEEFIAPITESQSSTIRLLLNPDGGVKVFAE